jgi:hypothetical protein
MRRGFNTEGMKDAIGKHPDKFLLDFLYSVAVSGPSTSLVQPSMEPSLTTAKTKHSWVKIMIASEGDINKETYFLWSSWMKKQNLERESPQDFLSMKKLTSQSSRASSCTQ